MKVSLISVVIPCFNEQQIVPEFIKRIHQVANSLNQYQFEFIFVNDGSSDETGALLKAEAQKDERIKVVHFARNFGHQIAISAGMDFASGDAIILIDGDLQDPPELIGQMVAKIEEGFDIVHARRSKRKGETFFKLGTAKLFYFLLSKVSDCHIVPDSGDFRAISKRALETVRYFRMPHKFLRGTFSELGFKQYILDYDRDARFAGSTKYPFHKMLKFALGAFFSFSSSPLRVILLCGLGMWAFSLVYIIKGFYEWYILNDTVRGWTSIIFLISFSCGLTIFCLAIMGLYISKIFDQGQKTPLYWAQDFDNIDLQKIISSNGKTSKELALSEKIIQTSNIESL